MASPEAIEIIDPDEFLADYHIGLGLTEREARRAIRALLETHNIFINPTDLDLETLAGEETENDAISEGTVWVKTNANGSTPIAGKPVVFDPISGNALTGIGDDWYMDEYVIFGYALKDGTGEDELLPVKLQRHEPLHDGMLLRVKSTEAIAAGDLDGGECEIYDSSTGVPVATGEFITVVHLWITGGGQTIPADTEMWARYWKKSNRFESAGYDC